jgi:hypothetical protein
MTILLPALSVAFAAFCVWLTVRIVNRRERWAKWTLAGLLIGLPVFYVASFGVAIVIAATPADEFSDRDRSRHIWPKVYCPIGKLLVADPKYKAVILWYANLWMPDESVVAIPISADGSKFFLH